MTSDARPPSWGVVLACVALAAWLAAAQVLAAAAPHPRRRYVGAHSVRRMTEAGQ